MKKKLVVIVVVITTVFVLSFAGCTAPDKAPEIINENISEEDTAEISNEQEIDIPNEEETAIVEYTGEGMTFEEFCVGMKDDLSPELLEEVRDLYERWVKAENDDDAKRGANTIMEIYEELVDLDVLTMEEQQSQVIVKPRP